MSGDIAGLTGIHNMAGAGAQRVHDQSRPTRVQHNHVVRTRLAWNEIGPAAPFALMPNPYSLPDPRSAGLLAAETSDATARLGRHTNVDCNAARSGRDGSCRRGDAAVALTAQACDLAFDQVTGPRPSVAVVAGIPGWGAGEQDVPRGQLGQM
jgi:hypothetical protein